MQELVEVLQPDPFGSRYPVPGRESPFQGRSRPIAECANKDKCREQKSQALSVRDKRRLRGRALGSRGRGP